MASSRGTSNGPDVRDIATAMAAFERDQGIILEMRLQTAERGTEADFWITCLAHQGGEAIGEAPPLASVSLSYLGSKLTSLDAALFRALYALDAQLALNEFERVEKLGA